jgi:hypothetical protein
LTSKSPFVVYALIHYLHMERVGREIF